MKNVIRVDFAKKRIVMDRAYPDDVIDLFRAYMDKIREMY